MENSPLPGLQIRKVSENGIPIAGVSITIQYKTGEVVGTYKTDAAGLISLPDLESGWYTCYESQTVPGFLLDMTPQDVLLEEGKVATLTFVNKAVPGLTILKKDSISGKGIGGVEIELRWETGELIGTYTTDSTGRIYAPLEAEKTVVAREVKTLPEYRLDPTERSVTLESGKANELIFENDPYPYLIIQKIDRSTKEPLSGVQFKISDDLGHEVGTYTTSATGRIVLTGINEGHYQVQEISPAPSYRPDNTVYDVYLSWGKTTTITIKNEKLASFLLKKVDMTAEYCSKKCGVITVRTSTQMSPQNPMFSFIYGAGGNRYSQTRSEGQRSLMLADEITRLDTQKCIALIGGHKPLLLCKVKPEEIPGFTELQPTRIMDYVPLWYALDQQRVELAKTRPVSAEFSTEAAVPPSPAVPERPWTQQPVQQMLTVEEPAMELQRYDFVHAHSPKTAASEERIGNMRRYTGIPDARKVMEQASESNDAINQTKYGE